MRGKWGIFLVLALLAAWGVGVGPATAGQQAGGEEEMIQKAAAAFSQAGMSRAEIFSNEERLFFSRKAQAVLQEAGLSAFSLKAALLHHPEMVSLLGGGGGSAPPPNKGKGRDDPPQNRDNNNKRRDPPRNSGGGGDGGGHGPADGFGCKATGGSGNPRNVPADARAIASALRSGGVIQIANGEVDVAFGQMVVGSNTTVDGGGVTFWCPGNNHNGTGLVLSGENIIVRNLRVRNGGDNLSLGSSSKAPAFNVLLENVTSSGSGDDGLSVSYRASDITFRWSLIVGCTRSIFQKYGGARLTMHHNIISRFWMRGPLCDGSDATVDFRNNLVEYWSSWGSECADNATGNFVNNTWRTEAWALGTPRNALQCFRGSRMYQAGNQFLNGCRTNGTGFVTDAPVVDAPPISQEHSAEESMRLVLSDTDGAGCMPRDAVDRAYLSSQISWRSQGSNKGYPVGLQIPETEGHLQGGRH